MRGVAQPAMERFESKVEFTDQCWPWLGNVNEAGYGTFNPSPGTKVYAHRWIYEQTVEPIPEGLQLDHLCFVRHCVNPDHLEAVTKRVNVQRNVWARATHCKSGHPFDETNTYHRKDDGTRQCRACAARRQRERAHNRPSPNPADPFA